MPSDQPESETRNQQVQTRIFIRPSSENHKAKALSNRLCQTAITAKPHENTLTLQSLLEFLPQQEIDRDCLKEYQLPRASALQWKLPLVTYRTQSNEVTDTGVSHLVSGNLASDYNSVNTVNTKGVLKKRDLADSDTLLVVPVYGHHLSMAEEGIDREVQTSFTVRPHVLAEEEVANLVRETSLQTSLTFDPDSSMSGIKPQITESIDHFHNYVRIVIPSDYKGVIDDIIDHLPIAEKPREKPRPREISIQKSIDTRTPTRASEYSKPPDYAENSNPCICPPVDNALSAPVIKTTSTKKTSINTPEPIAAREPVQDEQLIIKTKANTPMLKSVPVEESLEQFIDMILEDMCDKSLSPAVRDYLLTELAQFNDGDQMAMAAAMMQDPYTTFDDVFDEKKTPRTPRTKQADEEAFEKVVAQILNSCVTNIEDQLKRITQTFDTYQKDLKLMSQQIDEIHANAELGNRNKGGDAEITDAEPLYEPTAESNEPGPESFEEAFPKPLTEPSPSPEMHGDFANVKRKVSIPCECCKITAGGAAVPSLGEPSKTPDKTNDVTFDVVIDTPDEDKDTKDLVPNAKEQIIRFSIGAAPPCSNNTIASQTPSAACQCIPLKSNEYIIYFSSPDIVKVEAINDIQGNDLGCGPEQICTVVYPPRKIMRTSEENLDIHGTSQKTGMMFEQDAEDIEPYIGGINDVESVIDMEAEVVSEKEKKCKKRPKCPLDTAPDAGIQWEPITLPTNRLVADDKGSETSSKKKKKKKCKCAKIEHPCKKKRCIKNKDPILTNETTDDNNKEAPNDTQNQEMKEEERNEDGEYVGGEYVDGEYVDDTPYATLNEIISLSMQLVANTDSNYDPEVTVGNIDSSAEDTDDIPESTMREIFENSLEEINIKYLSAGNESSKRKSLIEDVEEDFNYEPAVMEREEFTPSTAEVHGSYASDETDKRLSMTDRRLHIKSNKLVYDPNCDRHNEPYMDRLYNRFPDDYLEGTCGYEIEMPWNLITVPINPKIRKINKQKDKGVCLPCKKIKQENNSCHKEPTKALATCAEDAADIQTYNEFEFDMTVSFTEATSNILMVHGGGASMQKSISIFSAMSDVRFVAKRCPKDIDIGIRIDNISGSVAVNSQRGSHAFTVAEKVEDVSAVTMDLKPFTDCAHPSERKHVVEKMSVIISVINPSNAPTETKSLCGNSLRIAPAKNVNNQIKSMPEIPSRATIDTGKSVGKVTFPTEETPVQDEDKPCSKNKSCKNEIYKDPIITALDTYQAEMKPLRETLNRLKEKVRELNLPGLMMDGRISQVPPPPPPNTPQSQRFCTCGASRPPQPFMHYRTTQVSPSGYSTKTVTRMKPPNMMDSQFPQPFQPQPMPPYFMPPMPYPVPGMMPGYNAMWPPMNMNQSMFPQQPEQFTRPPSRKVRKKKSHSCKSSTSNETEDDSCKDKHLQTTKKKSSTGSKKTVVKTKIPIRMKRPSDDGIQTHLGPKFTQDDPSESSVAVARCSCGKSGSAKIEAKVTQEITAEPEDSIEESSKNSKQSKKCSCKSSSYV